MISILKEAGDALDTRLELYKIQTLSDDVSIIEQFVGMLSIDDEASII